MNKWSIVKQLEQLIRETANLVADQVSRKAKGQFLDGIKGRFGFESNKGWTLLCHCLDLIGDCEAARANFNRFGVSGPTRYNDPGEAHLRLYGILNCAYQEGSAIKELFELFKLPGKATLELNFQRLELIQLRHMAGAHTVTFKNKNSKTKTSFNLSRPGLLNGVLVLYDDKNESTTWDINRALDEYEKWAEVALIRICDKAIVSAFRFSKDQLTPFQAKLNIVRLRAEGDVVEADENGNILMHFKLPKRP